MQGNNKNKQRVKLEHKFWVNGIEQVIKGYSEAEFEAKFVNFIDAMDFGEMTDKEK